VPYGTTHKLPLQNPFEQGNCAWFFYTCGAHKLKISLFFEKFTSILSSHPPMYTKIHYSLSITKK
jgi:hypothetical protein